MMQSEAQTQKPAGSEETLSDILATPQSDHSASLARLLPQVYDELRRLARSYLHRERQDHTLQPTALVHEAVLRLLGQEKAEWRNPAHLIGTAAQMMRRVLVNHAVAKKTAKRDGGERTELPDSWAQAAVFSAEASEVDLAALDAALNELESLDPRQAKVVELRYFVGLSIEETAAVLELSLATVKREWSVARAWLKRRVVEMS